MHVLNNRHEYGNMNSTVELLKTEKKGQKKLLGNLYIQTFQQQGLLIQEQKTSDLNALYSLVQKQIDTPPIT